ncbi:MAG: CAP domain-containing protein [Candidatus Limnocylindria bacterium]
MTIAQRPRAATRWLPLILVAGLLAIVPAMANPPSAEAVTTTQLETQLTTLINAERQKAGLKPLRTDTYLAVIAGRRADRMRDANTLSHTVGGNLSYQLAYYRVAWYGYGENVGYTTAAWGSKAAESLVAMWLKSPSHRAQLLSATFNYIGVGMAYRSSNGRTFASTVFTESPDHTTARATILSGTRSGDDVTWAWTGYDPVLQTHTAGLRDFDVQYRVGSGTWKTLRNDTVARSLTLVDRVSGRTYGLRVRATDRRGNVGPWTAEKRIWVP